MLQQTRDSFPVETNWACPHPNYTSFMASDNVCGDGAGTGLCYSSKLGPIQNPPPDSSQSDGPSWEFANHPGYYENIGYGLSLTQKGSFPYINSGHPGGFNVVMCDGSVHYLKNIIRRYRLRQARHLRWQQAARGPPWQQRCRRL